MFAKLFGSKKKTITVEERLLTIQTLQPKNAAQRRELLSIISDECDVRLSIAAVNQFSAHHELVELLPLNSRHEVGEAIQRRIMETVTEQTMDTMGEPEWFEIALHHTQARLRLKAAQQIYSPERVEELARRSRDKSVLRHVKGEVKRIRAQNAQQQADSAMIDAICAAVEGLVGRAHIEQFYLMRYQRAQLQWREMEQKASVEQQQRFSAAVAACSTDIELLQSEQQAEQQRQQALEDANRLLTSIELLVEQLKSGEIDSTHLRQSLHSEDERWQQIKALIDISHQQQQRYHIAHGLLQNYCNSIDILTSREAEVMAFIAAIESHNHGAPMEPDLKKQPCPPLTHALSWPEGVEKPLLLQQWEHACASLAVITREAQTQINTAMGQVGRLRRQLDQHINGGDLKIANRIYTQINKALLQLPDPEREEQKKRVQPQEEALQKLRDWHNFSTTPKKEALCQEMEGLIDSDLPPQELHDVIQALQQQWREQTAVNIIEDDPLWDRFQQAGHQAYEPCRIFFQQQDQIRQQNLQARQTLTQQLQEYIDQTNWEQVDWKVVEQILKSARAEWKRYEPVRYPDAKAVNKRYLSLLDQLNGRIKGNQQSNLEQKQALLTQVQALSELEDIKQAMDRAITLQQQWKGIGATFRKHEQLLWQQFRAACDSVFSRRDQEREAQRVQQDAQLQHASALIKQIETVTLLEDDQLAQSGPQIQELEQAFTTVDLPEKHQQSLTHRFNQALQRYQQQLQGIDQRRQRAALEHLAHCAAICDQAEVDICEGTPIDIKALHHSWEHHFSGVEGPDQTIHGRFDEINRAIEGGATGLISHHSTHLEQLQQLAIEMEVMTEIETPAEFSAQRMQYQLSRLTSGLNSGTSSDNTDLKLNLITLQRRWYQIGAVAPEQRRQLQLRLKRILAIS